MTGALMEITPAIFMMSAILPKADIARRHLDVCFGPKADIARGEASLD
jgi:hypothetical protein